MAGKSKYTKQQIDESKEKIIQGLYEGKSLKSILDNDDSIPSRPIVYQWLNSDNDNYDKSFLNNYTCAREDSSDIDADKIEDLNQEIRDGKLEPGQARVIADNLKWIAGKKKPKKYGDKLDLSSEDGSMSPKKQHTYEEMYFLKYGKKPE